MRKQYAEVQALYNTKLAQGMTQAQAATGQAGDAQSAALLRGGLRPDQVARMNGQYMPAPPINHTWKDGDTVTSVASQYNLTPTNLLSYNPDVREPKTGMVVQVQQPQQYRPPAIQGVDTQSIFKRSLLLGFFFPPLGAINTYQNIFGMER